MLSSVLLHCPWDSTLFPYSTRFRSPLWELTGPAPNTNWRSLASSIQMIRLHGSTPRCFNRRKTMESDHLDRACERADRKSTRLNSSHLGISYAVFCLKKKIQ